MMKPNLFAAQEREAKLSKLGDALQVMERHVDFTVLACIQRLKLAISHLAVTRMVLPKAEFWKRSTGVTNVTKKSFERKKCSFCVAHSVAT